MTTGRTTRSQQIREFILTDVGLHPKDVAARTAARFGVSRQAVNLHVRNLLAAGQLTASGRTVQRTYTLATLDSESIAASLAGLKEDVLWRREVATRLEGLPTNVDDVWHYGFTEMVNNAIDHSAGTTLRVRIGKTAVSTTMWIVDDGVGIFRKIQRELGLEDERHALLELAKGKLTTDPAHHSGEGIFFASRMFDDFVILSGGVHFSHRMDRDEDWILEPEEPWIGTAVFMSLMNKSPRTTTEIFNKFSSTSADFGFSRTIVPVSLARHGKEKLISRSQAKRLLARFERFKVVILDFEGVEEIGQAFADEIFRVFPAEHPAVKLVPIKGNAAVKRMIRRARSNRMLPMEP